MYCLKCREKTNSKHLWVIKTKGEEQCFYQTVWFVLVKNKDLLKNKKLANLLIGQKTPPSEIALIAPIIGWMYKMNETINKVLLAGDKFIPEMHLSSQLRLVN